MDQVSRALLATGGSAAAAETIYVDDVFSTFLYTGTGSTQTITNGINLATNGGLVWTKNRTNGTVNHRLYDTARGTQIALASNVTDAQTTFSGSLTSFGSSGFTVGTSVVSNNNGDPYVSWTFRDAPKFFDVVTYTGNGGVRTVNHSLGVTPGCIITKRYDGTGGEWTVWHRTQTDQARLATDTFNRTNRINTVTSTSFNVIDVVDTNASGGNYVAYLFAHDTAADGLIQCGSYTGNGSATGPTVTLGWEPQWLMIKDASGVGNWVIFDTMRGLTVTDDSSLCANDPAADNGILGAGNFVNPTATGFSIVSTNGNLNDNTNTYVYIAIRRPNKPPTTGTQVFTTNLNATSGLPQTITTNFVVDLSITSFRTSSSKWVFDRLRGGTSTSAVYLDTTNPASETLQGSYGIGMDNNTGIVDNWIGTTGAPLWSFRRAPGFFDVVCYTGTGANRTVSHNLGVVPELIIVKCRSVGATSWDVYSSALGATKYIALNASAQEGTEPTKWNSTAPTASVFTVGTNTSTNGSTTSTYVAYLFASLPGISKVGSYTGNGGTVNTNGTSQTINCGFTAGARFILIKRTDAAGDWYTFDTARGIVAASDPYLLLNSTAAEVTTVDAVDPDNSGFVVNQTSGTNLNVTSATYIYLAIA